MNIRQDSTPRIAYELQFRHSAGDRGAVSFPCDVKGNVDMDRLGDEALNDYLFARAVMKLESLTPEVVCRRAN
jgi:hypothetical protein